MKYILLLICIVAVSCKSTSVINQSAPIVSITFDDGRDTIMSNALPIMNKYNITGTMYMISGMINEYGHVREYDIKTLINNGWEIGAHSIYHEDLTKVSTDSMKLNLIEPKEILENRFNILVRSFASPYGEYNYEMIEYSKYMYASHVNAWSDNKGLNNLNEINPYNIHRIDVTSDISSEFVCDKIDNLENGQWFVLLFHNVLKNPVGNWDTSVEKFEEIIKCSSKLEVKNISEVVN